MTGRSLRQFNHRGRQKRPQRIAPALAQLAILPPSCTHSAACAHAQVAHAGHSPPVLVCKIWRCLPSATAPPSQAQHSERGKLTKDMAGISVRCTSFGPGRSTSILRITCTVRVVEAHTGGAAQRGVTETNSQSANIEHGAMLPACTHTVAYHAHGPRSPLSPRVVRADDAIARAGDRAACCTSTRLPARGKAPVRVQYFAAAQRPQASSARRNRSAALVLEKAGTGWDKRARVPKQPGRANTRREGPSPWGNAPGRATAPEKVLGTDALVRPRPRRVPGP